jgi:alpha-tubulin suppressor-like RCC1 family protein
VNANGETGGTTLHGTNFNDFAKLTGAPDGTVVDVAAGDRVSFVVLSNGDLYVVGLNTARIFGNPATPPSTQTSSLTQVALSNVATIELTFSSAIALSKTGTVYTWGYNFYVSEYYLLLTL